MKRMSRHVVYVTTTLLTLAVLGMGTPRPKQPFTLTLEAPKQPLKEGQPLILRVKVTNTSNHEVRVPITEGAPFAGFVRQIYQVHVLDGRGQPAPPWVPPPPPKGKVVLPAGSAKGAYLQPGKSVTDEVNLSHLYDLSQPGKYRIWIAEPYYHGPHRHKSLVKSDTITVTVVK